MVGLLILFLVSVGMPILRFKYRFFYYVKEAFIYFYFYFYLSSVLIRIEFCQRLFLSSYGTIHVIFLSPEIYYMIRVNHIKWVDFLLLSHLCILNKNYTWSWIVIFLMWSYGLYTSILLRIFVSILTSSITIFMLRYRCYTHFF